MTASATRSWDGPAVDEQISQMDAESALEVARQASDAIRWNEWIQRRAVERARDAGATIVQMAEATGVSYDAMRMRLWRREQGGTDGDQG